MHKKSNSVWYSVDAKKKKNWHTTSISFQLNNQGPSAHRYLPLFGGNQQLTRTAVEGIQSKRSLWVVIVLLPGISEEPFRWRNHILEINTQYTSIHAPYMT